MFIGKRQRKTPRKGQNVSGPLQPIDMDPRSSPGVTACWRTPDSSGLIPSFLRKQESMFIGTRRRKRCRKGAKCLRWPSADQNRPRVRHPGLDPGPGWRPAEEPRIRHPGLDPGPGCRALNDPGFVRPHSVIPAKAGIHVHRNETTEALPERGKISPVTFSRSK
jgi:hypothetical protein